MIVPKSPELDDYRTIIWTIAGRTILAGVVVVGTEKIGAKDAGAHSGCECESPSELVVLEVQVHGFGAVGEDGGAVDSDEGCRAGWALSVLVEGG